MCGVEGRWVHTASSVPPMRRMRPPHRRNSQTANSDNIRPYFQPDTTLDPQEEDPTKN